MHLHKPNTHTDIDITPTQTQELPMNITNALTAVIAKATALVQTHADRAIGNMTLEKALHTIERLQAIRDREAVYAQERACKACIKKAQKRKANGL